MIPQANKQPEQPLWAAEDAGGPNGDPSLRSWRVLIVDDDEDVHSTTRFAIGKSIILGRPIHLIHVHSAAEARELLRHTDDVAVALVDVVMETSDAGLKLVRDLRADGHDKLRIVLRTGQPGYAPEMSVISEYQIDDYRTKAELTRTRLLTVLTASIRAYEQICRISHSRAGLEMIVRAAKKLFQRTNLELFSQGVLTQIASLLGVEPSGIVCMAVRDGEAYDEGQIVSGTGRFGNFTGKPAAALDDPEVAALLQEVRSGQQPIQRSRYVGLCFRHEAGRELSVVIETTAAVEPEDVALLKLFSTNIAIGFENLSLLERLDRLAFVDPVLDAPNLNAFEAGIASQKVPGAGRRMALIHVESLAAIVASHGSRISNGYLKALYDTLAKPEDPDLLVARVGDGVFALLGTADNVSEQRIAKAFSKHYRIHGIEIVAPATTIMIDLTDRGSDPAAIMRTANAALLYARQVQRGNCAYYDTTMQMEVEEQIALQIGLKEAIVNHEGLAVHLQPKINLQSDRVCGAEALLRWSFKGKMISPAQFIPIAETAGLIQDLTDYIIKQIGIWNSNRQGQPIVPVAVNLSMADLNRPGFAERLLEQVARENLSPETICFEVTEGIAMQDKPWAIEQVRILKQAGFGISLDDFGTGYSSLGYFSRLPIDTLKIDKSFISLLDVKNARGSLAAIILGMAQTLNVDCIAEGIETLEQKQALLFLGCTVGQGYLFGRPVPIAEFDAQFISRAQDARP